MKDFMILKFLDKFQGVFKAMDVDYTVMRKILQLKLTMDGRRVPTIMTNSSKKKNRTEGNNNFLLSLLFYGFIGCILLFFVLIKNNYIFSMSLTFGMIMFMIMSTVIADFSSVLLDVRDKNIITTKPVSGKTLSMAKVIHILNYMILITASLTGPSLIASLIRQGIGFFVIYLIEIILMDLFVVAFTALLYLIILHFFDGERLKDIINYFQIGLTLTLALGYQLVGRLFDIIHLGTFTPKWWQYFIPPVWFGGPFEVLLHGNCNINFIWFSALAVIVPVASIVAYIRLMPHFEKSLQKFNNNTSIGKKKNWSLALALSKIICFTKNERLFFRFALDMMKNEREFKLKVYPSLGLAVVFPFIFILSDMRHHSLQAISFGRDYFNIYFCALLLPTAIMMMKYSSKYKAAWIYKVAPIKNEAEIYKGTVKAYIVRLLLPLYFLDSIIFMAIFGVRILPDLICVLFNMIFFSILCFRILQPDYPFSQPFDNSQQSAGLLVLPLMLVLGVLALIHFVFSTISFGIFIYMGILIILNAIGWKKAFNI